MSNPIALAWGSKPVQVQGFSPDFTPALLKHKIMSQIIRFFIFITIFIATQNAQAQRRVCTYYVPYAGYSDSLFADLKNAQIGESYAKCWIANEYETFADSNFVVTNTENMLENRRVKITLPIIEEATDSIVLEKRNPKWAINTKVQDNVLGINTKAALVKFQKDNGLPIGSLDFQTLKALGVAAN